MRGIGITTSLFPDGKLKKYIDGWISHSKIYNIQWYESLLSFERAMSENLNSIWRFRERFGMNEQAELSSFAATLTFRHSSCQICSEDLYKIYLYFLQIIIITSSEELIRLFPICGLQNLKYFSLSILWTLPVFQIALNNSSPLHN